MGRGERLGLGPRGLKTLGCSRERGSVGGRANQLAVDEAPLPASRATLRSYQCRIAVSLPRPRLHACDSAHAAADVSAKAKSWRRGGPRGFKAARAGDAAGRHPMRFAGQRTRLQSGGGGGARGRSLNTGAVEEFYWVDLPPVLVEYTRVTNAARSLASALRCVGTRSSSNNFTLLLLSQKNNLERVGG